MTHQKEKKLEKITCFEELSVFSAGLEASFEAWKSCMEALEETC
jgi:hypothetical protein